MLFKILSVFALTTTQILTQKVESKCKLTGCFKEICTLKSNADIKSNCNNNNPNFKCYKNSQVSCGYFKDGTCAWIKSDILTRCFNNNKGNTSSVSVQKSGSGNNRASASISRSVGKNNRGLSNTVAKSAVSANSNRGLGQGNTFSRKVVSNDGNSAGVSSVVSNNVVSNGDDSNNNSVSSNSAVSSSVSSVSN